MVVTNSYRRTIFTELFIAKLTSNDKDMDMGIDEWCAEISGIMMTVFSENANY